VALGAINVFGGFVVTDRILEMFRGSARGNASAKEAAHE
jgi:NAD/NADP transhydrogenase alpha subunit